MGFKWQTGLHWNWPGGDPVLGDRSAGCPSVIMEP